MKVVRWLIVVLWVAGGMVTAFSGEPIIAYLLWALPAGYGAGRALCDILDPPIEWKD